MKWPERRLGGAAVILDADRRVLLVRHTYGRLNWELPGGASEAGESIVDTAMREVREETGLEAHAERLTGIYYHAEYDAHHFVFRCRISDPALATATSAEISACDASDLDSGARLARLTDVGLREQLPRGRHRRVPLAPYLEGGRTFSRDQRWPEETRSDPGHPKR